MSVVHNGVLVIDRGQFDSTTGFSHLAGVASTGPIMLQEHGTMVRFRNLKIKELRPGKAEVAPLPPTFRNGLGMEFVLVPKGKSWLGGGGGKPGTKEVEMPYDFYLGKFEVTQEEWEKLMGSNPMHSRR